MKKLIPLVVALIVFSLPARAIEPFPRSVHAQDIKTSGTTIHVRIGDKGAAVVMLHRFADTRRLDIGQAD